MREHSGERTIQVYTAEVSRRIRRVYVVSELPLSLHFWMFISIEWLGPTVTAYNLFFSLSSRLTPRPAEPSPDPTLCLGGGGRSGPPIYLGNQQTWGKYSKGNGKASTRSFR